MSAMRKPSGVPVKVSLANDTKLQEWANADERPTGDIVNELIERHERERFWNQAYDQLARLKADPVAWQDYYGGNRCFRCACRRRARRR